MDLRGIRRLHRTGAAVPKEADGVETVGTGEEAASSYALVEADGLYLPEGSQ
jgi:hypothetical protein